MGTMPTRMVFTFIGDPQIDRTLTRISAGARNAAPAFDAMGQSLLRAEQRQFGSEGGYGSGGWAPLSPAYAAAKRRRYGSRPILVRTGDLKASLTSRPFGIDVVEAQTAVFGTALSYAGFLQGGTPRMPARQPIQLPETIRQRWVKILQAFLLTGQASE